MRLGRVEQGISKFLQELEGALAKVVLWQGDDRSSDRSTRFGTRPWDRCRSSPSSAGVSTCAASSTGRVRCATWPSPPRPGHRGFGCQPVDVAAPTGPRRGLGAGAVGRGGLRGRARRAQRRPHRRGASMSSPACGGSPYDNVRRRRPRTRPKSRTFRVATSSLRSRADAAMSASGSRMPVSRRTLPARSAMARSIGTSRSGPRSCDTA